MKQMRPLVTPAARENLTVGRKGDRPDLTAAIFSNVREHITVVYASPPLDLRLSPGEGGRHATLRKGGLPMSGEGVESQLFAKCGYLWPSSLHLATVNIPQPDRPVARPTDKQGGI